MSLPFFPYPYQPLVPSSPNTYIPLSSEHKKTTFRTKTGNVGQNAISASGTPAPTDVSFRGNFIGEGLRALAIRIYEAVRDFFHFIGSLFIQNEEVQNIAVEDQGGENQIDMTPDISTNFAERTVDDFTSEVGKTKIIETLSKGTWSGEVDQLALKAIQQEDLLKLIEPLVLEENKELLRIKFNEFFNPTGIDKESKEYLDRINKEYNNIDEFTRVFSEFLKDNGIEIDLNEVKIPIDKYRSPLKQFLREAKNLVVLDSIELDDNSKQILNEKFPDPQMLKNIILLAQANTFADAIVSMTLVQMEPDGKFAPEGYILSAAGVDETKKAKIEIKTGEDTTQIIFSNVCSAQNLEESEGVKFVGFQRILTISNEDLRRNWTQHTDTDLSPQEKVDIPSLGVVDSYVTARASEDEVIASLKKPNNDEADF